MSKTTIDSSIPPTEPQAAKAPARTKASPKAKIAGNSLVPDLTRQSAAVAEEHWYWLGLLPECPVKFIDAHGVQFPMVTEDVRRTSDGRTERIPRIGALVKLRRDDILRLRDRLPRTVIRFVDDKGRNVEPGAGQNMGDPIERPRKGYVITIPRDEDVKARQKAGFSTHPYVQGPNDEPAARYMFAVLCANQERGSRGDSTPDTLEKTGLEWPGELE